MKRLCFALTLTLVLTAAVRADNRYIITQSTPSDCGPSALATLLTYYLDVPSTEAEMIRLTKSNSEIGTTFLRLEEAATAKGCTADSFRMTWDVLKEQMATYPGPVIVRTLLPEPHFSVLLSIQKDSIFLADPAAGNIILRPEAFLNRWYIPGLKEGFVFIVAAPDSHVNLKRYNQIVKDLAKQLHNLKTVPTQIAPFRR